VEDNNRFPYLAKDSAYELLSECINAYEQHTGQLPSRLSFHKSSPYTDEELAGLLNAAEDVHETDFMSIGPSKLRLLRNGDYPVPRGSVMKTGNEMHLYTTGYVSALDTYPGTMIPRPIKVRMRERSSTYQQIARELLELSKLSWNNAGFFTSEPLTLEFSRKIGKILSEMESRDQMVSDFRYYM